MTIRILQSNELFDNIQEQDLPVMLHCLGCRRQSAERGDFIFLAGKSRPAVGILMSGKAQIEKENIAGDAMIIGTLRTGDLFGETYACMGADVMPVSVVALEKSDVLLLDVAKIVHTCRSACKFHQQLIANLLKILAEKNMRLNRKMSYLSHKTIRSRLEAYFSSRAQSRGSLSFSIPFNRTELAEYLCIDRSAMSRELARMKNEGILDYRGKTFYWMKK